MSYHHHVLRMRACAHSRLTFRPELSFYESTRARCVFPTRRLALLSKRFSKTTKQARLQSQAVAKYMYVSGVGKRARQSSSLLPRPPPETLVTG